MVNLITSVKNVRSASSAAAAACCNSLRVPEAIRVNSN